MIRMIKSLVLIIKRSLLLLKAKVKVRVKRLRRALRNGPIE
jgi:hypothetical protein